MAMHLLDSTNHVLSGLKNVLHQIDNTQYNKMLDAMSDSTIGQHTRHTIEFFQCLLRQSGSGVINYDKRDHNQQMEENSHVALQALEQVLGDLAQMHTDRPLKLETTFSEEEDDYSLIDSSYYREWSYALEHAIHHMAIIKIGLKIMTPDINIPENFGVSPATIKYRQRQCAQ